MKLIRRAAAAALLVALAVSLQAPAHAAPRAAAPATVRPAEIGWP